MQKATLEGLAIEVVESFSCGSRINVLDEDESFAGTRGVNRKMDLGSAVSTDRSPASRKWKETLWLFRKHEASTKIIRPVHIICP